MSELGLSEVLLRLDRLATAVQENGDRVSDRVIELDRKLDDLGQTTARLEGTVTNHIQTEEMWRTEVSGRFQVVEFNVNKRLSETEDRLIRQAAGAKKVAAEAKEISEKAKELAKASTTHRDIWRAQIAAVAAVIAAIATFVTIVTKIPACVMDHKANAAVKAMQEGK